MTEAARTPSTRRANTGGIVQAVRPGSLAEDAGLRAGDRIVAINGRTLRDAVDFQFHAADETLDIAIVRDGEAAAVAVEKHPDEDLGVDFQDAAFDGVRTCNNACFFCFLKGNPKGMRRTLYVKDDDYRLSFFHGNFVTLTNLTEDDWTRLAEQRLSPLNVSVHATDVELRRYLLGNRTAPDICAQLRRLGDLGIQANTQVVLCPGVNDGVALDRTIEDLAALYPAVQTISIVPVGETSTAEERIARGAHAVETAELTAGYARSIIAQVRPYQRRFRALHGASLVYLADEFYLAAGAPLPSAARYDGFAQYENGIGMARSLLEDWHRTRRRTARLSGARTPRRVSFVSGTLIAPTLAGLARDFGDATGLRASVHAIENRFFGPRVNVSGLLVADDIASQLAGKDLGDLCMLPRYALDYTGARFLDDTTPGQLQDALGVPIAFASSMSGVLTILADAIESGRPSAPIAPAATNGKAWVDWTADEARLGGRGLAKEVRR